MEDKFILLVEDDSDIATVIGDQLELDGYTVATAHSGEEGLAIFRRDRPDLVILDLNLPDMDGLKWCSLVRKESSTPIIILSARDTLSDKVRGLGCGADDYMVKPFEYLELAARVEACLRRYSLPDAKQQEPLVELGSLKIDRTKRAVSVEGREWVPLTRKEFDLLDLFLENKGKILNRDYLCSHLWPNQEVYPWSRSLDVHIRRLRKKIEPDPNLPRYLVTHPGVGYRLEPNGGT